MKTEHVKFITDRLGNREYAIIPYHVYEELISLKELLKNVAPIGAHEIYTFTVSHVKAMGYPDGIRSKPGFTVIKDSMAVLQTVSSTPKHIMELRENLLSDGSLVLDPKRNCFVFSRDVHFLSPSTAAAVVAGNVRNGLLVWVNREGFTLKDSGFGIKKKDKQNKK